MNLLMAEFNGPEVTLCSWQDVKLNNSSGVVLHYAALTVGFLFVQLCLWTLVTTCLWWTGSSCPTPMMTSTLQR